MVKISQSEVAKSNWRKETIPFMQVAVFTMCGGGFIGRLAAEQPANFYVDDRVKRLKYPKKEIYQAVETLKTIATVHGLNTHDLPAMPRFYNMGVF